MPQEHRMPRRASQPHKHPTTAIHEPAPCDAAAHAPAMAEAGSQVPIKAHPPNRGLAAQVHSRTLQERIRIEALMLAHRFRVIRTIDVAVACFAERPFKAALAAAQRAMRGMVTKDELLRRYRSDRFQTIYGLTARGVAWLAQHDLEATASVRRVSDMSNPEHRLWAQFLTLCCEARGLTAYTEQELLGLLTNASHNNESPAQGILNVTVQASRGSRKLELRPDAVGLEPDGLTWFEVDRSMRSSDRSQSLRALVLAMGKGPAWGSRCGVWWCSRGRPASRAACVPLWIPLRGSHKTFRWSRSAGCCARAGRERTK